MKLEIKCDASDEPKGQKGILNDMPPTILNNSQISRHVTNPCDFWLRWPVSVLHRSRLKVKAPTKPLTVVGDRGKM